MRTLRRSTERQHVRSGKEDIRLTFYAHESPGPPTDGFGILDKLDDVSLAPGGGSSVGRKGEPAEVIIYAYEGAVAQEDSAGGSAVVHCGEFEHSARGPRVLYKRANTSRTDSARIFEIFLQPSEVGLVCARQQKRFTAAMRHNRPCVVASPDGRYGSLHIRQDAIIHSSILDPGRHLIHELLPGRSAWLHVICGQVALQDLILAEGDGAGITLEPAVSVTAEESSEILLIDLGPRLRAVPTSASP